MIKVIVSLLVCIATFCSAETYVKLVWVNVLNEDMSDENINIGNYVTGNERKEQTGKALIKMIFDGKATVVNEIQVCLQDGNCETVYTESSDIFYVNKAKDGYDFAKSSEAVGSGFDFYIKKQDDDDDVLFIDAFDQEISSREPFVTVPALSIGKPEVIKKNDLYCSVPVKDHLNGPYFVMAGSKRADSWDIVLLRIKSEKWKLGE